MEQHIRGKIAKYKLRVWVRSKYCPMDLYFKAVDELRALAQLFPNEEGEAGGADAAVAGMLGKLVAKSGALATWLLDEKNLIVDDKDEWALIDEAAGWALIAVHDEAVAKGKGTK